MNWNDPDIQNVASLIGIEIFVVGLYIILAA